MQDEVLARFDAVALLEVAARQIVAVDSRYWCPYVCNLLALLERAPIEPIRYSRFLEHLRACVTSRLNGATWLDVLTDERR
jgi:hypothetical protein